MPLADKSEMGFFHGPTALLVAHADQMRRCNGDDSFACLRMGQYSTSLLEKHNYGYDIISSCCLVFSYNLTLAVK